MPGSTSLLADLGQWVPRRGTATRPVQMRMADANGPHDPSAPAPTGRPAPTMMAAGVAGSSASGRVMRTTALANGSESPTSRPTMKCQTTSVRLPPTIATRTSPHAPRSASRRRAPWSSANAAVTEPRRADADSDQHHRPSVLLRRAQTRPVKKLVEAYTSIATLRRKGWSFSLYLSVVVPRETPMRRYPPPVRL
jgi:hypothetical protein